ncbi:MAG: ankyrin repeat domain-containing protein [Alphaproteobacteria bacterium]|nr:ankyrin repeat domain-containing protein [Alphaproteobacteria bacterium]
MNIDILLQGTDWGVMHFKFIAYLILFYTALAIVSAVYAFLLFSDWLKHKCLISYVQSDSMEGVERVLKTGVDVNEKNVFGKTPLMGVVRYAKDIQILEQILGQADLNAVDESGNTPLMVAAQYNTNEQIIQKLIYEGANIHSLNYSGRSALMLAAAHNTNTAIVDMLINAGSRLNATDAEGKTALMMAAQTNPNPQVVEVLLMRGADKTKRCSGGRTAYDYAHENVELYQTQAYMSLEV